MSKYPTPKEIMAEEPEFPEELIWVIKEWKKVLSKWKTLDNATKTLSLEFLILAINPYYGTPTPNVKWDTTYKYNSRTKKIYLNVNNPSIISTLHELGHHIYGKSELKACQFSVHLFKRTFPKSFEKLKWKEHMLVK